MTHSLPGHGRLHIGEHSSLRKRIRAARRVGLPPEILQKISMAASEESLQRHAWYRRKKSQDAFRALFAKAEGGR